jgi:hypothetical protein
MPRTKLPSKLTRLDVAQSVKSSIKALSTQRRALKALLRIYRALKALLRLYRRSAAVAFKHKHTVYYTKYAN